MPTLRQFLESDRVKAMIAPHVNGGAQYYPEVVREVVRLYDKNPAIGLCSPRSIVRAVRLAATWPVRIGDGSALIPRRTELDPANGRPVLFAMLKAKAKIQILREAGIIRWANARCVYMNEHYVPRQGANPDADHVPIMDPHGRGALKGAYAIVRESYSGPMTLVEMHRSEIDAIRVQFSEDYGEGDLDDIPWYAPKTCLHRIANELPLDSVTRRLLTDDDDDAGAAARAEFADDATVTVPVADPRAVVERAGGWPMDPRAPKRGVAA